MAPGTSLHTYYIPTIYFYPQDESLQRGMSRHMLELKQTICHSNRSTLEDIRRHTYSSLNGDCFYPDFTWPTHIRNIIYQCPLTDQQTFIIFLFFLGNGCSPYVISTWILTSYYNRPHKLDKRIQQITWILRNIPTHSHRWFFYHIDSRTNRHMNGHTHRPTQ